ncbi:MAG TPA: DegT/DnrJ/EryC1/StrS family aminotransferase [Bryobacteraceae bacterium]|jgi:dTDP-4-amino-4,6-dideoxygalactose transaminase|nr:DegT/DnrJ/EryC1/StrS family aminotransferase [Bryobacteraceae bacterium]
MRIPNWPQATEREAELLKIVLASPQWGGFHPFVAEFEQRFTNYQQGRHGISTFNGTVSLELALEVLDVGPGDEIIVPSISFISTATAVSRVGATPVFVDIEEWSFNMDPMQTREALSPRTKGIVAVHFGGSLCRVDELQAICLERELFLLEDAAHAQGSEWKGKRAGSFGIAGSFSFQNGKVLSSGEGGLLITSDDVFAEEARSIANQGRIGGRSFYEHHRLGTNFRLTGFQAAVLLAQLESLPMQIEQRAASVRLLKSLLMDVPEIVWQEELPELTQNSNYLLLGRLRDARMTRSDFCRALSGAGVPCTPFYPHPLYGNPLYQAGNCRILPCPVAEACVEDAFWFPHRLLLSDEETIAEVAHCVRKILHG